MKNNKGFTLVELLASIVILGILMWYAIPQITGMLSNSRNKMFVSDAKKLISQAEYKMKSQNSVIEKPADGNCIVLSLVFLDNGDFSSTPNEGSYEKEASYVVVKNNNSDLEYSANLIEKSKKGDLRGVTLTRESSLDSRRSASVVKNFDELVGIESDLFTIDYVNDRLGDNYCEDIEAVYNKASYSNPEGSRSSSPPIISRVSLTSTSKKNYNTPDATLALTVTDDDTLKSDIKVYLSTTSYEDARRKTPENYGDNETFLKEFNFDTSVLGNTVSLYIVVKDDKNNETKKKLTYPIHVNDPPTILSSSYISKRNQDNVNMPTARLVLDVTDDNDTRDGLSVCFSTNKDSETCSGYQGFTSVFGEGNTIDYSFSNNSCYLNGDVKFLKVFVRDSNGLESSQVFEYAIFNNQVPSISDISIDSQIESFTTTGSLRVKVNFNANDDYTDISNLRVRLSDGTNTNDYSYQAGGYDYVFSGGYDGNNRTLTITVFDQCNKYVSVERTYSVYSNGAPSITNLSVQSKSNACSKVDLCPLSDGGTYTANVSFDVSDDSDSDVLVCVSENESDCSNNANYKSYNQNYRNSFEYNFTKNCSKEYNCDNQDRNLYVYAKDSSGVSSHISKEYKIYRNNSPVLKNFSIVSVQEAGFAEGSKKVRIMFTSEDDYTENSSIKYKLTEGTNVLEGVLDESGMADLDYTFTGEYNGEVKNLVISLEDTDGYGYAETKVYNLHNNQPPVIDSFNVISNTSQCINDVVCPTNFNNYLVNIDLKVTDDIDSYGDSSVIMVCVSEDENGCSSDDNYISYSNYGSNLAPFTFSVDSTNPYQGSEKTLYLKVKDSYGSITSDSYNYTIYTNVAPVIESFGVYSNDDSYNSIEYVVNSNINDDFGTKNVDQKICYTVGDNTDEVCLTDDYVDFKRINYGTLTGFDYDGTIVHFYSYFKDNYGLITKSDTVDYELYEDVAPVITEANAVVKSGSSVVSVGVSGDDIFDTYQIGISETSNGTYTYSGTFDGSSLLNNVVTYTPSWDVTSYYSSLGTNYNKLYIKLKDSHGKLSDAYEVEVKKYAACDAKDSMDAYYEYELDTTKTDTQISASKCSGKCYFDNEEGATNITSYYKQKISYKDKFGSDYCLFKQSDYEANCSFKDCFYNEADNNYVNKVIGTTKIISDYPWTVTLDSEIYVCYTHYNLYTSSYNEGDGSITLTPTNTKICGEAISEYGYKPDDLANSYLFADDFMYVD